MARKSYLNLQFIFLRHFGVGDFTPAKDIEASKYSKFYTSFQIFLKVVCQISLIGGALRAETLSDFALCCSECLNILLGFIKFLDLFIYRKKVYKLMKLIEVDRLDHFNDERFMEAGKNGTRSAFIVYMAICFFWMIGYYTGSFRDLDMDVDSKWSLMPLYTPYEYYVKGRYGVMQFALMLLVIYQAYCSVFLDVFSASMFLYISQQFNTVAYMFENVRYNDAGERERLRKDTKNSIGLCDEEGRPKMPDDLRKAILFHEIILECADDLQTTWRYIFLFQVMESCMPLCLCLYLFLHTVDFTADKIWDTLGHLNFLVYLLYQLYLMTSCADKARCEALLVSEGAYFGNWTIGSLAARKQLLNVIHRANKPLLFTALGLYNMNMVTFISILRAPYGAFALMRNFT